jgi:hypothetical protein
MDKRLSRVGSAQFIYESEMALFSGVRRVADQKVVAADIGQH